MGVGIVQPAITDEALKKEKSNINCNKENPGQYALDRRGFLKALSYTAGATVMLSSCEQPVRMAIPYLIQPEEIIPGKAVYYATTYNECGDFGHILVKVRDGRPIKIEPNKKAGTMGTTAQMQASILSLYDPARIPGPMQGSENISWTDLDKHMISRLQKINEEGKKIALIVPSNLGPSSQEALRVFRAKYTESTVYSFEPFSRPAVEEAHRLLFGKKSSPQYAIDRSSLVISFGADFLGTYGNTLKNSELYALARKSRREGSGKFKHIQLEPGVTLTGMNADERIAINPSEEFLYLSGIAGYIKQREDKDIRCDFVRFGKAGPIARTLLAARERSILCSGSSDLRNQLLVCLINHLLGNYGNTLHFTKSIAGLQSRVEDSFTSGQLKNEIRTGRVGGVITLNCNPFSFDRELEAIMALTGTPVLASISSHPDETGKKAEFLAPAHFYLESWGDALSPSGDYSLLQPVIQPLFNTRQAEDCLLAWADAGMEFRDLHKNFFRERIFGGDGDAFESSWMEALQQGKVNTGDIDRSVLEADYNILADYVWALSPGESDLPELDVYKSVAIGNGKWSNNPWLQELPDPVSKVTWGNYAAISAKLAERYGIRDGDSVEIEEKLTLPAVIQPGQADNTVSVAFGYGRRYNGPIAVGSGEDVSFLITGPADSPRYSGKRISLKKTKEKVFLAKTQHTDFTGQRNVTRDIDLDIYLSGDFRHDDKHLVSFYKEPSFRGHHWGMTIDLDLCTGCSACMVSCQAENNIPVVGKEEVLRGHDMHWIKIDRYYDENEDGFSAQLQPLLCQHCDFAPCENVCPVAATNHSSDGLNQMVYNRCIGTRYCANNCPYKVRRFNWYDYNGADSFKGNRRGIPEFTEGLPRLVLNPDVTVRARGVIEKCSFCVQRIQEAKINAKKEGRAIRDGEVMPACVSACPAEAMVFGDMNDPESRISRLMNDRRAFRLLEELNTRPSVTYLSKLVDKKKTADG